MERLDAIDEGLGLRVMVGGWHSARLRFCALAYIKDGTFELEPFLLHSLATSILQSNKGCRTVLMILPHGSFLGLLVKLFSGFADGLGTLSERRLLSYIFASHVTSKGSRRNV